MAAAILKAKHQKTKGKKTAKPMVDSSIEVSGMTESRAIKL